MNGSRNADLKRNRGRIEPGENEDPAGTETKKETTIARAKKTQKPATNLRDIAVKSLDDDKAEDVIVIDLSGKTTIADFMIIASGRSQRHVAAIADHLAEKLKHDGGLKSVPTEGTQQGDWVLIDAGDVIIHLFRPEVREFYNLEKMWAEHLPEPDRSERLGAGG